MIYLGTGTVASGVSNEAIRQKTCAQILLIMKKF
jgi:hypothetical protein